MDYFTATENIKGTLYASADFYRVMQTGKLALGIRDRATKILWDIQNSGTPEAKQRLSDAVDEGTIVVKHNEDDFAFYDVASSENQSTPYFFFSHFAMQLAFPELYKAFSGSDSIIYVNSQTMADIVDLGVSCLTNPQHPSDYWGEHEVSDAPKPPKAKREKKEKRVKQPKPGFQEWVAACKQYKKDNSAAWVNYINACKLKAEDEIDAKAWKDEEVSRLRDEIQKVNELYHQRLEAISNHAQLVLAKHTELKVNGKPKREQFL